MSASVKNNYLFKVFDSNRSGKFIVIDFEHKDKIWIQFLSTGHIKTTALASIKSGKVKDHLYPNHMGHGYIGVGDFSKKDSKAYNAWTNMLSRVHSGRFPSYEGCLICPEWYNFQDFAKWYYSQPNSSNCGFGLDKDLGVEGGRGKLYSPETCRLISKYLNTALIMKQSSNTSGSTGVYIDYLANGTEIYRVGISINGKQEYLGSYLNKKEAEEVYLEAKKEYLISKGVTND